MSIPSRLIDIFLQTATIEGLSGNEEAVKDYIKAFLSRLNISLEEDNAQEISGGNSGNLIGKLGSGGNVVLLSHMDTARSTADLNPIVDEEKICSDGRTILGADNRAGISAILYAIEYAYQQQLPIADFTVAFTVCEETNLSGSRYLALNDDIQMGFVFDSSFRPGNFVCQSFGAQKFSAAFLGKAAHSGIAPEKGISAIAVAADAINRLRLGRIDEITTANIGLLEGGMAVNVVPEKAHLQGEVRSLDPGRVESVISEIQAHFSAAAASAGATLNFSAEWEFKPYCLTENMPVYQKISSAIRQSGLIPTPQISPGGSDANALNAKGIPTVNIGIGAQNPHANDEFILKKDLLKAAEIALALIQRTNN